MESKIFSIDLQIYLLFYSGNVNLSGSVFVSVTGFYREHLVSILNSEINQSKFFFRITDQTLFFSYFGSNT
ncbi:hypothetical protein SPOG_05696 [Schizosaccharomyces cryophilus OY26]|uniref:Uncharacterized protein n=1 Tax=Schizosaccharomyces cryophilus (strain OY26 / ATCC MYA-4695 / CBS 11777 / NBRC 106824 / NRRL Y48691) TaxID=653667 RepID=S9X7P7_SCHCR|nr:uncharacterized protein SPOG_05696 [Schizosaccharomyces cryophilus OY26]EPY53137.1 hypothetical protein SPOG_05696 [Schizosaccharomyces cryophilus OY26]